MTSDFQSGLPVNILRGIVPTATLWDGTIGYAYEDDGGVFTDETVDANDAGGVDVDILPLVPAVNDAFYFGEGFATSDTFNHLKIDSGQVATVTTGAGVWEYYDVDTTWKAIPGLVDETNGFQTAGAALYVYWTEPATWQHVVVNGQDRYWVRFRCTDAGYTQQPKADQIWLGKSPTSLANVTDGDIATVAGTGIMVIGAGGFIGGLTFDLGASKNVMVGGFAGIWSSASTSRLYTLITNTSTLPILQGSTPISLGAITSATESTGLMAAVIGLGRYIHILPYGGGAGTQFYKFYSIFAYEMGL